MTLDSIEKNQNQPIALESQSRAFNILQDSNVASRFIYNIQTIKLEKYGRDKFEQALRDGENEVRKFNSDQFMEVLTKFLKENNVQERICKYNYIFANKEFCLNNNLTLENNENLENILPDDTLIDSFLQTFEDIIKLKNPEILTSQDPQKELDCIMLSLIFNAICSGDTHTEL